MLKAEIHPKIVRERLGHSSVTITPDTSVTLLQDFNSQQQRVLKDCLTTGMKKRRLKIIISRLTAKTGCVYYEKVWRGLS